MNKAYLYYYFKITALFSLMLTATGYLRAQNDNILLQGKVYDVRTRAILPGATVHMVLDRNDKKYPLVEGRQSNITAF